MITPSVLVKEYFQVTDTRLEGVLQGSIFYLTPSSSREELTGKGDETRSLVLLINQTRAD